jgi:hypothetical protein
MRLLRTSRLILLLLASTLLGACNRGEHPSQAGQGAAGKITTPPPAITLAYIGDLRGFQRPCG